MQTSRAVKAEAAIVSMTAAANTGQRRVRLRVRCWCVFRVRKGISLRLIFECEKRLLRHRHRPAPCPMPSPTLCCSCAGRCHRSPQRPPQLVDGRGRVNPSGTEHATVGCYRPAVLRADARQGRSQHPGQIMRRRLLFEFVRVRNNANYLTSCRNGPRFLH